MPRRPQPANFNISFANSEHRALFRKIKPRLVLLTKFPDNDALRAYGWEQGVRVLLRKGGLGGMLDKDEMTFHKPTLEFVASMEPCEIDGAKGIRFQMKGRIRYMKYDKIAHAFGWTLPDGVEWEPPPENELKDFWHSLTGLPYDAKASQNLNQVVHPCFRFAFLMINLYVMSKGEPGKIRTPALRHFWPLAPEATSVPNYVDLWVDRMQVLQGETGHIYCGGMVTLLARELGIEFTEADIQVSPHLGTTFDPHNLQKSNFIKIEKMGALEDTYLMVNGVKEMHLPPPRGNLFHILPGESTFDCRHKLSPYLGLKDALGSRPAPGTRAAAATGISAFGEAEDVMDDDEMEESDEDYDPYRAPPVDPMQASTSHSVPQFHEDELLWRQSMNSRLGAMEQRLDRFEGDVIGRLDVLDSRQRSMESSLASQFDRMFIQQGAVLDYYARYPDFRDPRVQGSDPAEASRQFVEPQQINPSDGCVFPGTGPGASG